MRVNIRFTLLSHVGALAALLLLVPGTSSAQGGLASLVAIGAQNLYITPTTVPTIFDGAQAPCTFGDATPLTNQLSSAGLTFSGTGSVLNQCSDISIEPSQADNNFLAFAGSNVPVSELITFSANQSMLLFSIIGSPMVSVAAMMGESTVASGSFGFEGSGHTHSVVIQNSVFNSVMITGGGEMQPWALDDLYSTPSAAIPATVPEPATLILLASGLCALAAATWLKV